MSRKPEGLFGPNGKPLGWKPKPRPILGADSKPLPQRIKAVMPPSVTVWDDILLKDTRMAAWKVALQSAAYSGLMLGRPPVVEYIEKGSSRDLVQEQLLDLLKRQDLSGFESGVQELPEGEKDMTSYVDAFAAAAKNCPHRDYEDTMYAKREAKCNDCGRYFKRPKGLFGF